MSKQAVAIAERMHVERGDVLRSTAEEFAVVVRGGELARSMVLCVRAGPGFPDAEARHAIDSEHLAGVTGLPQRQVRGSPICSRLEEYLPAGSLRSRVQAGPLSLGEAVTVLLAVWDVLEAAHRAGFAGLEPRDDQIRFRADGCPVITGLSGISPLSREGTTRDAGAFFSVVRQMASAISDGNGRALLARVERVMALGGGGMREELLTVAPPVAVRLSGGGERSVEGTLAPFAARARRGRRSAAVASRQRRVRGDLLLEGNPLRAVRSTVLSAIRRRPKLTLTIVAPLVGGALILAAAPSGGSESGGRDSPTIDSTHVEGPSAAPMPSPASSPAAPPSGWSAGSGDGGAQKGGCADVDIFELTRDATTSSGAPVDERAPIDESASVSCATPPEGLAARERGETSAADDPGEAALALLSARGDAPAAGMTAEVMERWGDAALVRVVTDPAGGADSEPASLLLVRTEAGWRIRAVYS